MLDIFGVVPFLYINKERRYGTKVGKIMTLIIILLTLSGIIYFGQELVHRKTPSVNFSLETEFHPKKVQYFTDFEFMIALQNQNDHPFINERVYYPVGKIMRTTVVNGSPQNSVFTINMEPCSNSMPTSELLIPYDLNNYYCISKKQEVDLSDIYIQEFWGHDSFQMMQIELHECKNRPGENDCESEELIESLINNTKVSIYMLDTMIQTRNHDNPFSRSIKEIYYYASRSGYLSVSQYFKTLKIESDDGFLFTSESKKYSYSLDTTKTYTAGKIKKQFMNFNIIFDNTSSGYYRKYYKFQELASQVGGVFSLLTTIGFVIMYSYNINSYNEHLIKCFISTEKEKIKERFSILDMNQRKDKISSKKETVKSTNIFEVSTNNFFERPTFKERRKKIENIHINNCLKLFPLQILYKCSKGKTKTRVGLFFAERSKIINYLSVIEILKNFIYFDSMKEVMLRKNKIGSSTITPYIIENDTQENRRISFDGFLKNTSS